MPLTKRQSEILTYLQTHINGQGYDPSFEEIAEQFGFQSLATSASRRNSEAPITPDRASSENAWNDGSIWFVRCGRTAPPKSTAMAITL